MSVGEVGIVAKSAVPVSITHTHAHTPSYTTHTHPPDTQPTHTLLFL